jgi:hypothetical protein
MKKTLSCDSLELIQYCCDKYIVDLKKFHWDSASMGATDPLFKNIQSQIKKIEKARVEVGMVFEKQFEEISSEEIEYLKCANDVVYFVNHYVYLDGDNLFRTYKFQEDVLNNFKNGKYTIIKNSRRMGLTSLATAFCLWSAIFAKEKNMVIFSMNHSNAKNVNRCFCRMYDSLPHWMKVNIVTNNINVIVFENGASFRSMSITSGPKIRGIHLSLAIFDEAAHMDIKHIDLDVVEYYQSQGTKIIVYSSKNSNNQLQCRWFDNLWSKYPFSKKTHLYLSWKLHPLRNEHWKEEQIKILGIDQFEESYLP